MQGLDLGYSSESDADTSNSVKPQSSGPSTTKEIIPFSINFNTPDMAPDVQLDTPDVLQQTQAHTITTKKTVIPVGQSGFVEKTFVPDFMFRKIYSSFKPTSKPIELEDAEQSSGPVKFHVTKRLKSNHDASDIDNFSGPWSGFEGEDLIKNVPLSAEQQANADAYALRKNKTTDAEVFSETATFYGEAYKDYLGKSFLAPVAGFKPYNPETSPCYVPKDRLYTYTGHDKGVNAIRFFPQTGRYLLSASLDSTIRLWDVEGKRSCVQLYSGHTEAVRTVGFSESGSQFYSVSYDKYVKIWDTETGAIVSRITDNTVPVCASFYPINPNEILVGGNGKVTQWDLRSNEIIQEYKDARSAVNTITFFGDNDKFVTTSDDQRILAYDYGVPVVIKNIQETEIHSIAAVGISPDKKHMIGNAQNNQILVLAIQEKVKLNRRKVFSGHITSGFSCGLGFSPDGKFIVSGDAEGKMVFWDFKTGRLVKKIKAHGNVTIDTQWHPADPNIVASCSWDGTIKLWR